MNCTRYAVEKNINEFITFHYYFSFHYCHYITLSITSKNTIVSRLYLNERTHLPLANMDWAKLLDQDISLLFVLVVRMGHVVKTRVLAEEGCDLFILSICKRL